MTGVTPHTPQTITITAHLSVKQVRGLWCASWPCSGQGSACLTCRELLQLLRHRPGFRVWTGLWTWIPPV